MVNTKSAEERRAAMNRTSQGSGQATSGSEISPQREIAMSLLINAVAPIALFYGLRAAGVDQWTALMLGLVPPAAKTAHSVITSRRIDMLGGLVMTALVLSVGLSFLTGSPRTLLARDGWITGVLGLWIFLTLTRPTPYYLFALLTFTGGTLREQIKAAWSREPAFRRVVHIGTMIWGSAFVLDAASTVVLAYTMPIDSVPLIGAVKLVVLILLAEVVSQLYFRRNGKPHLDLEALEAEAAVEVPGADVTGGTSARETSTESPER